MPVARAFVAIIGYAHCELCQSSLRVAIRRLSSSTYALWRMFVLALVALVRVPDMTARSRADRARNDQPVACLAGPGDQAHSLSLRRDGDCRKQGESKKCR